MNYRVSQHKKTVEKSDGSFSHQSIAARRDIFFSSIFTPYSEGKPIPRNDRMGVFLNDRVLYAAYCKLPHVRQYDLASSLEEQVRLL